MGTKREIETATLTIALEGRGKSTGAVCIGGKLGSKIRGQWIFMRRAKWIAL